MREYTHSTLDAQPNFLMVKNRMERKIPNK